MKVVRAIISIILVIVMLGSAYLLEEKLNEYRTALDIKTERTLSVRKGRSVDFDKLKEENSDVKGWIWLDDTNIDYPIVQTDNNDYYLHRDFNGNYLYDGCPFIDAAVEDPFHDFNTVIYGHRMRSGAMFHDLSLYKDKDFFDSHKIIILETEDQSYDLHVVAFCTEMSDSDLYTTTFADDAYMSGQSELNLMADQPEMEEDYEPPMSKTAFVELVRNKAKVLTDEPFDENDTYVTLSTCAFATGEQRNQVIGVLKKAPMEEKTKNVAVGKPFVNKWLVLQIAVGVITVFVILLLFIPKRSKNKQRR